MARRQYSAFLIRHWSLASGAARIEVRHIQSGTSATVPTLHAAAEWIGAQALDPPPEPPQPGPDEATPEGPPDGSAARVCRAGGSAVEAAANEAAPAPSTSPPPEM
jgi:hypothetical protein